MSQPQRPSVSHSVLPPSAAAAARPQSQQPSGTLADLTACLRSTTGEVPPPLVGASITVLGTSIYVFGGRLVPTRLMISDMYRLDLHTLEWQKIWPPPAFLGSPLSSHRTSDSKGKAKATDHPTDHSANHQHHQTPTPTPSDHHHHRQPTSSSISIATEHLPTPQPPPSGPHPRYFHSAEAWGHKLVIFGGMGYAATTTPNPAKLQPTADSTSSPPPPKQHQPTESELGLCVLDDLVIFDSISRTWSFPTTSPAPHIAMPSPRYAHLSCLTCETGYDLPVKSPDQESNDYIEIVGLTIQPIKILKPNRRKRRNLLTLLGGQDISNRYIGEINVLDLDSMQWIEGRRWERHCGTYRSVACTAQLTVRQGDRLDGSDHLDYDHDFLRRLSWSEKPSVERPEPVYLYSNFNFNDVRRDLELISYPTTPPPLPATPSSTGHFTTIHPLSHTMGGVLPTGLRFPTGAMVGNHMIISGTSLNQDKQRDQADCFAIWALDLSQANHKHVPIKVPHGQRPDISTYNNTQFGAGKVIWQRIDPGRIMMSGSWNRAVGWGNCLVILGNKDRNIVDDYHHRQINFVDLAFIDLEPFAIYQPPFSNQSYVPQGFSRETSLKSARLGLSLLSNVHLSDFEIVCVDGTVIPLNKRMLQDRWPWFRERLNEFKLKATKVNVAYQKQMQQHCQSKLMMANNKPAGDRSSSGQNRAANGGSSSHTSSRELNQSPSSQSSTPTETSGSEHSKPVEGSVDSNSSNTTAQLSMQPAGGPGSSKIPEISLPESYQVTPRSLYLPHPSVVVQALVEYLFTNDLVTPLHQAPAVLCSLLILATTYKLEHLRMLTVHGLHRYLSPSTTKSLAQFGGPGNVAALIYEAATLSGCMALQIRSLKAIIAAQSKQHSANAAGGAGGVPTSHSRPAGAGGGGGSVGGAPAGGAAPGPGAVSSSLSAVTTTSNTTTTASSTSSSSSVAPPAGRWPGPSPPVNALAAAATAAPSPKGRAGWGHR
ncbi:hypothetical protein PCANC_07909 [Puccinia coronata f. sp. avenae]|uniref:BTB domain-containing protein n=1 Tax=Puccinia coronata f. sp. avenae TaxID=200324 RepID=A0A2N5UQF2_9BASI|nr:hypothetical protein PCASD_22388 [Puccinia coronata f. sp. avenae]PLW39988.1 hypothetical protein PCASD_06809 [Puccinia coronata f. sp. avenae]PLW42698.1 hypothetical protein PCANC_07909 [Puccinia coronata f. sp. avenae]